MLLLIHWYRLITDGSSDEDDKFLPALIRHVDKDSGLMQHHYLTCQLLTVAK